MEGACEHGLTRGTFFTARRLEAVAVAGLLWIFFVVCFGCGGIFRVFFRFFTSNAHGLLQVGGCLCLIYLSTSNEAVFLPLSKKASSYRGAYRVPLFN